MHGAGQLSQHTGGTRQRFGAQPYSDAANVFMLIMSQRLDEAWKDGSSKCWSRGGERQIKANVSTATDRVLTPINAMILNNNTVKANKLGIYLLYSNSFKYSLKIENLILSHNWA